MAELTDGDLRQLGVLVRAYADGDEFALDVARDYCEERGLDGPDALYLARLYARVERPETRRLRELIAEQCRVIDGYRRSYKKAHARWVRALRRTDRGTGDPDRIKARMLSEAAGLPAHEREAVEDVLNDRRQRW